MTDMVEKWRLDEANVRIAAYARLAGDIYRQQSSLHITDKAMRAETGRLLAVFFGSGMGVVRDGGTPVDGGGAGAAVPARPVAPPNSGRPGTDLTPHGRTCIDTCCLPDTWAMGSADYASPLRIGWEA